MRDYPFIIFVSFVLISWSFLLVIASTPLIPTPVYQFWYYIGQPKGLAALFLVVAILALYGVWIVENQNNIVGIWLLTPQLFVALVVSIGALTVVIDEKYPDGVQRMWQFMAADQIFAILLGGFHLFAVMRLGGLWKHHHTSP